MEQKKAMQHEIIIIIIYFSISQSNESGIPSKYWVSNIKVKTYDFTTYTIYFTANS